MRMDIIKEWIRELVRGDARQIRGQLGDCNGGRCCLGVLADVVFDKFPDMIGEEYERTVRPAIHPSEEYMVIARDEGTTDSCYATLPNNLWSEIAGTTSWNDGDKEHFGSAPMYETEHFDQCHAYGWNDNDGLPFRDIAEKIAKIYGLNIYEVLREDRK